MARVLAVEDDEDVLNLISTQLRRSGHAVVGAATAEAALQVVSERGAPDVLVLDVNLPDMDGRELLAALREKSGAPDLPAIFLSARVDPADVEAGRGMGAQYLTKPFVLNALLAAIERSVKPPEQEAGTW